MSRSESCHQFKFMMNLFLIGALLVVSATSQIYTVKGPDGYKYIKPQARMNVEEVAQFCPNGGTGEFCCTNGADNAKCQLAFPPLPVNDVIQESFEQVDAELPPLPASIPAPALQQVIPVKEIVASPPASFAIQGRSFEDTASLNEYLPPLDYLPPNSVGSDTDNE